MHHRYNSNERAQYPVSAGCGYSRQPNRFNQQGWVRFRFLASKIIGLITLLNIA